MEIQKKILLAGVGLVVVLSAMQFILPRENEKNAQAQLRIGAGDAQPAGQSGAAFGTIHGRI